MKLRICNFNHMPNIGTIVESYHDGVLGELSAHLGDELDEELAVPVGHVQADELHRHRGGNID